MASSARILDSMGRQLQVNILGDKETGKLLYLEAGKRFVDLLISLLLEPLGKTLNVLAENPLDKVKQADYVGIVHMYNSVITLSDNVLRVPKQIFLSPNSSSRKISGSKSTVVPPKPDRFYRCSYSDQYPRRSCNNVISRNYDARCPFCIIGKMTVELAVQDDLKMAVQDFEQSGIVEQESEICGSYLKEEKNLDMVDSGQRRSLGFVKEAVAFTITDRLEIFPTNTCMTFELLKEAGVSKMENLESFNISVDKVQIVKLLQAAYQSKTVLNDVFGQVFQAEVNRRDGRATTTSLARKPKLLSDQ